MTTDTTDPFNQILDAPFDSALSERYLVYALSTITARSLPDVRDGLKPVHRRLLWAMRLLKMDPAAAYKKSARVVGDVIGKYHPHGDQSVYDAMVRLAQNFALRYPLVDGQGNFGNIDGDNAAAYRYTEARLTQVAIDLMTGLDEDAVGFRPTYNNEDHEPELMPGLFPNLLANGASGIAVGMATSIPPHNAAAYRYTEARLTQVAIDLMTGLDEDAVGFRPTYNNEDHEPELMPGLFPNLLANGASGIAVGMATSIPPHNAAELIDAAVHLIDQPEGDPRELMRFVKGPDFPTGGIVVDSEAAIAESYATGRGSFRVRAKWAIEDQGRGTWVAVVSEIPYQVPKAKLIEQIAALINDKKLPILADVRDESDEQIRIVIEPRARTVDPQTLLDSLFRLTDLETRVPLNLNVLDRERTPRVMSLKQALAAWIDHQFEVLVRRSNHRLAKIADRIELLDGYLVTYLNLDRVIQIIREQDEPKPILMAEFELTDRQAEAILNMRLRSLRKLEEMELRKEREALDKEARELTALVESPGKQRTRLKRDLAKLRERYSEETELGRRRTLIEEQGPAREIPLEAMIEREPISVILSQRGWIRAMKGHIDLASAEALKFKEGDGPAFAFHAQTTDKLLLVAATGRVYTLAADKLPGGRGFGEPVRLMIDLEGEAGITNLFPYKAHQKILFAASDGKGFVAKAEDAIGETRKGRQVANVRAGATLRLARPIPPEDDYVAAIGDNRKLVVFPLSEVPELARGQGAQLQRYRDGGLADVTTFRFEEGLSWPMGGESGRFRTETDLAPWRAARGAAGRMPPTGFPRDNRFGSGPIRVQSTKS